MNTKMELLKTLIREDIRRTILTESMPGWRAAGIPEKLAIDMVRWQKISPNIKFKEISTVPNEDQLENGHIIISVIDSENAVGLIKMRAAYDERYYWKPFILRNGKNPEVRSTNTLKQAMAKYFKPGGTLFIGKNDIPLYNPLQKKRLLYIHPKKRGVKKGDPNFTTDKDVRAWDDFTGELT